MSYYYQTVLFDLDGTLIDTNELILHSFEYTLEKHYPGKYKREDIIPHMGDTLFKQMERFAPEMADELVQTYREHNEKVHDDLIEEFPHVKETVKKLYEMGIKMGIVTTKQRKTAEMGVRIFGLISYMDSFITYQDTERHKPDPDPVLKAMEELKADPDTTLMVGDSHYDILAAQNAGIDVAGVSWSIKGLEHLMKYNPTYMIDDMRELLTIVKNGKDKKEE